MGDQSGSPTSERRWPVCTDCDGRGYGEPFGEWNEVQTCPTCHGRPSDESKLVVCASCEGSGICGGDEPEPCYVCDERGWFDRHQDTERLNDSLRYAWRLLTVERERRQRAEREAEEWRMRAELFERQLDRVDGALPKWEATGRSPNEAVGRVATIRNLVADRARAQRLAEALEEIAAREPDGSVTDENWCAVVEITDVARDVLASVPDREAE